MTNVIHKDVVIIGAGSAGIAAFSQLNKTNLDVLVVDHGPLGTTCARLGCMPSKAVLHAADTYSKMRSLVGDDNIPASVTDRGKLWKTAADVRHMLGDATEKRTRSSMQDKLLIGKAKFIDKNTLDVDGKTIKAKAFVIATGSRPIVPGFLSGLGDKLLTTDNIFDLDKLPKSIGLLGLGAVGLEMGLAMARFGVNVVAGDMKPLPAGVTDPEVGANVIQRFSKEIDLWLGQSMQASVDGDTVSLTGSNGSQANVDMVLAALGRRPNTDSLGLENTGVDLDDRGSPIINAKELRLGQSNIFIAGDSNAIRPLLHEGLNEGLIVGRNAANFVNNQPLDKAQRAVPLGIVFSNPDIAVVGIDYDEFDENTMVVGTATGDRDGRSIIINETGNIIRVYADRQSGRILGASMMATNGESIAHLLALAIQRQQTLASLLQMPFYHPTIEELLQSALQSAARQLRD